MSDEWVARIAQVERLDSLDLLRAALTERGELTDAIRAALVLRRLELEQRGRR